MIQVLKNIKLNRVKLFIKISIYVKINILSLIFFLFLTFSSFFSLFKILVLACPWKNATKGIVVAADRTVSRLHWCNRFSKTPRRVSLYRVRPGFVPFKRFLLNDAVERIHCLSRIAPLVVRANPSPTPSSSLVIADW